MVAFREVVMLRFPGIHQVHAQGNGWVKKVDRCSWGDKVFHGFLHNTAKCGHQARRTC